MASPSFTAQVNKDFGSYTAMITALDTSTMQVPGSGWGWLVYDTKISALDTTYTIDDDLLDPTLLPILNIDIVSVRICQIFLSSDTVVNSGSTHSSLVPQQIDPVERHRG